MSFAIEVFSGTGRVRLDETKRTVRLIKTMDTYGTTSGSVQVPDFSEAKGLVAVNQKTTAGHDFNWSWDEGTKTFSWSSTSSYAWAAVMFIHTE